jgi:hypothetical protein
MPRNLHQPPQKIVAVPAQNFFRIVLYLLFTLATTNFQKGKFRERKVFQSGSLPTHPPALNPPEARGTSSSFFAMKPGHGHFQTSGNGGNFIIHQITLLPLNPGNRRLIENNPLCSQPPGQIILRNRRFAFKPRFTNAPTDDVSGRQLMGFFHKYANVPFTYLTSNGKRGFNYVDFT